MEPTTLLVFNHFYRLRHDLKRSHILAPVYVDKKCTISVQPGWTSMIHPVYAMIFSFFSTTVTLSEACKKIAYFLDMPEKKIEEMITPFINNQHPCNTQYGGITNFFPKNIIIEPQAQFAGTVSYSPEQFAYMELDLSRQRFYTAPVSIVFMVNNTCATDCIYCYANRAVKNVPLPFERVKEIVEEANKLGVSNFSLVGGEVFLYKYWKELLNLLIQNNLRETTVSTKVPLKEADIIALKSYDISIQISLDAVDTTSLIQILNVTSDYAEKIRHTIRLLDKHAINFKVATVLTKYNDNTDHLNALHDFLSGFKNLKRWDIRVGFRSLYSRKDFDTIKSSKQAVENISAWVEEKKKTTGLRISWSNDDMDKYFKGQGGSRKFGGSRCSANYSNIMLLPDGKVTICEQLYWDPRFIIGDLTTQSIAEVWNSRRALELSFPKREDFRDKSVCKTCDLFDECFAFPNKCFADVLKGYGKENWDYPDPRCNKAPSFINDLRHM